MTLSKETLLLLTGVSCVHAEIVIDYSLLYELAKWALETALTRFRCFITKNSLDSQRATALAHVMTLHVLYYNKRTHVRTRKVLVWMRPEGIFDLVIPIWGILLHQRPLEKPATSLRKKNLKRLAWCDVISDSYVMGGVSTAREAEGMADVMTMGGGWDARCWETWFYRNWSY